jgi:hypothetical protein
MGVARPLPGDACHPSPRSSRAEKTSAATGLPSLSSPPSGAASVTNPPLATDGPRSHRAGSGRRPQSLRPPPRHLNSLERSRFGQASQFTDKRGEGPKMENRAPTNEQQR